MFDVRNRRREAYPELQSYHQTLGHVRRSLGAVSKIFAPWGRQADGSAEGQEAIGMEFRQHEGRQATHPNQPLSEARVKADIPEARFCE